MSELTTPVASKETQAPVYFEFPAPYSNETSYKDPVVIAELINSLCAYWIKQLDSFETGSVNSNQTQKYDWISDLLARTSKDSNLAHDSLKQWLLKYYGIDSVLPETSVLFDCIIENAEEQIAAELQYSESREDRLKKFYREMELRLKSLAVDMLREDTVLTLREKDVTRIMIWFLDVTFSNLSLVLKDYQEVIDEYNQPQNPSEEADVVNEIKVTSKRKALAGLLLYGFICGQLRKNHPNFEKNVVLLQPYLSAIELYLPKVVLDELRMTEGLQLSRGQVALKKYWQDFFVTHLLAHARVQGVNYPALIGDDLTSATNRFGRDPRRNPYDASGRKAAEQSFITHGDVSRANWAAHREQASHAKTWHDSQSSKQRMQLAWTQLVATYSGQKQQLFFNSARQLNPEFQFLRTSAQAVLQVFVTHKLLPQHVPINDQNSHLQQLSLKMQQALESTNAKGSSAAKVEHFLGSNFRELSPLEQCSLLIFTAISLVGNPSDAIVKQAATLISQQLQPLINSGFFYLPKKTQQQDIDAVEDSEFHFAAFVPTKLLMRQALAMGVQQHFADQVNWVLDTELPPEKQPWRINRNYKYYKESSVNDHTEKKKAATKLKITRALLTLASLFTLIMGMQRLASEQISNVTSRIFAIPVINEIFNNLSDVIQENIDLGLIAVPAEKDREAAMNEEVRLYAKIRQLPEKFGAEFTGPFAYIIESMHDASGWNYRNEPIIGIFPNSHAVARLPEHLEGVESEQLVYEINQPGRTVYPVDGYSFTAIYYVGGNAPHIGSAGTLEFVGEVPQRLLIVASPTGQNESELQGADFLPNATLPVSELHSWEFWSKQRSEAVSVNQELASEPGLQSLHARFIADIDALYDQKTTEELSAQELGALSELILKYSDEFKQYIDETRYYSLGYMQPLLLGKYPVLLGISRSNFAGVYCTVPNVAFQEFMESVGVTVLLRHGSTAHVVNDSLLVRNMHVNSLVLLPDGRLLRIDMTPTRNNPNEDFSFFDRPFDFPDTDSESNKDSEWTGSLLLTIGATLGVSSVLKGRFTGRTKVTLDQRLQQLLPSDEAQRRNIEKSLDQILLLVLDRYQKNSTAQTTDRSILDRIAHDGVVLLAEEASTSAINNYQSGIRSTLLGLAKSADMHAQHDGNKLLQVMTPQNRLEIISDLRQVRTGLKSAHREVRRRLGTDLQNYLSSKKRITESIAETQKKIGAMDSTETPEQIFAKIRLENKLKSLQKDEGLVLRQIETAKAKLKQLNSSVQIVKNCLGLIT